MLFQKRRICPSKVKNMSETVNKTLEYCLFTEEDMAKDKVTIEGIANNYVFSKTRIEEKKEVIVSLVSELPKEFNLGTSFNNLCFTKDDVQWTGDHLICERLMALAMACKVMQYCFPRSVWPNLPGHMPFLIVI